MLLVEDNQLNAEIAAELLKMSGVTVDCAWDGIEAVDCLANLRLSYQVQHRAKKGKTLRALCVRMKLPHTN